MPTDKRTHIVATQKHKKCGAKIPGTPGSACRHTAKSNGRCQAHGNLTIKIKQEKQALKLEAKRNKRIQAINKARKAADLLKPVVAKNA